MLRNKKSQSDEKSKNYELIGKDPLNSLPNPQMRLYGYSGVFENLFFDTEEELMEYLRVQNIQPNGKSVIDYLGNVLGRSDVIRLTDNNGKQTFYTAIDNDGYATYHHEKSMNKKEFIWEYNYGDLREIYSAFRSRGASFENDIYAKEDEYFGSIASMLGERFEVLAVPCNRAFTVSAEQKEKFKSQRPDPAIRSRMEEVREALENGGLVDKSPVLRKVKKPPKSE